MIISKKMSAAPLVGFYAQFGYEDEGISESTHGDVVWHQMRLTF